MKTTIKVEVLGASEGVYVSLGDHVLKTYDTYTKDLYKVISTAEKYAMRYINKFFKGKGIVETYKHNLLITHIEY